MNFLYYYFRIGISELVGGIEDWISGDERMFHAAASFVENLLYVGIFHCSDEKSKIEGEDKCRYIFNCNLDLKDRISWKQDTGCGVCAFIGNWQQKDPKREECYCNQ